MGLDIETATRKLAAVMFTDIKGFSKKMAHNETAALELLKTHDALMRVIASKYEGKVVKSIGDSFMVDFASAVNAVKAAIDAQKRFWNFNKGRSELDMIEVRIGIHLGDVMLTANDMYGDGVNIASRIEAITEPNHICISADIYSQIKNKMELKVFRIGPMRLKNIPEPVEVFEILIDSIPELANPSATAEQAFAQQNVVDSGETESEEATTVEAVKKRGNLPTPKADDTASKVEALFKKAEQLYNEGKIDEAERTINEIAKIDPDYHAALERKKADEEKEKKVNEHYERAGGYMREGKFDLAEKEVKAIFEMFPLHSGAQQLQLQIEEERYRKSEEERNIRLDQERKARKEVDKQVDDLTRAVEDHIEKDELVEARETLQKIYSIEPNLVAGERLEEKLRRAEAAKVDRERQQAFLDGQRQRQEVISQNQERQLERPQPKVRPAQEEEPKVKFDIKYVAWPVAVLAVFYFLYWSYPKVKRALFPVSASIAVVPFSSASNEPLEDTLDAVIPALLSQDLSVVERMTVVSSARKNVQPSDYPTIAASNQVRYVLHGSVKKNESGFTVSIRLFDNEQQSTLLSQKFDTDYPTLYRVRRGIVKAIVDRLEMESSVPEISLPTASSDAYEYYLKGMFLLEKHTIAALEEAKAAFETSATVDSSFASAYSGEAQADIFRYTLEGEVDPGLLQDALDLAHKATRLNPDDLQGCRALAQISLLSHRFDKVNALVEKCLSLQPDDPSSIGILAELEIIGGNHDRAYADAVRAVKKAPDDANLQVVLGLAAQFKKSYPEAVGAFKRAIALGLPDSLITDRYLANALSAQENYDDLVRYYVNGLHQDPKDYRAYYWITRAYQMKPSISEFKDWCQRSTTLLETHLEKYPTDAVAHAYLGLLLARNGKSDDGEVEISRAASLAPRSTEILFRQANFFAIEGKRGQADSSLRVALNRDFNLSEILNPDFVLLANDTAFTSAITRNLDLN